MARHDAKQGQNKPMSRKVLFYSFLRRKAIKATMSRHSRFYSFSSEKLSKTTFRDMGLFWSCLAPFRALSGKAVAQTARPANAKQAYLAPCSLSRCWLGARRAACRPTAARSEPCREALRPMSRRVASKAFLWKTFKTSAAAQLFAALRTEFVSVCKKNAVSQH